MSRHEERDEVSEQLYPFLVQGRGVSEADVLTDVRTSTLQKCCDVVELRRQVLARHRDDLVRGAQEMADAFRAGATLFAFGNGGSATDAQDIAADFVDPPLEEIDEVPTRSLPAVSLTNDIGVVTAVGNDVGFDNVFTRQIIAFGQAGDIAMGISTSGMTQNVIVALQQAKKQQMMTIGIAGYDGGKMADMDLDFCFVAPSTYIPRIQEAHATIYHTLWELVQHVLGTESEMRNPYS